MRKLIIMAVVLGGLLAPLGAHAEGECDTDLIIFSYPAGLNSQAVVCILAEEEARTADHDPRLINPASDSISLRYTTDLGAGVPTLTAIVDGLGFDAQEVVLSRDEVLPGLFAYDSPVVDIPAGPTATGCVTATIASVEATTTFHTLAATCE